eukprot:3939456-Rhodomonas_salina.3
MMQRSTRGAEDRQHKQTLRRSVSQHATAMSEVDEGLRVRCQSCVRGRALIRLRGLPEDDQVTARFPSGCVSRQRLCVRTASLRACAIHAVFCFALRGSSAEQPTHHRLCRHGPH